MNSNEGFEWNSWRQSYVLRDLAFSVFILNTLRYHESASFTTRPIYETGNDFSTAIDRALVSNSQYGYV